MKKFLFLLLALVALALPAYGTDIDVGTSSITGFNTANAGVDTGLSGVTVALGSPNVTCSSCLPAGAVGLSGMKVSLGTPAVTYDIASVTSRSAFTLTANYAASSGTVTGTLHKFVHLRIYVLSPFVPSGSSVVVQSGAPGSTAWYRRYGVSIINDGAQNVAHVPAIDNLPATTDSSVPTARYYAAFYTQGGGFMQSYPGCVDDFRLSHQTTPTSWAQICTFNSPAASPPPQPINFYTTSQIDSRFPSCTLNNLDYFAATGNVKSCLALSAEFSISGGVLSLAGPSGVNRVQEEGVDLPQRQKINFVGSSFTAADDVPNTRTNVTADPDLDALASNVTNGLWARTGAGTGAARTITGTANEITAANGDGVAGNPTLSLPAALTFTGKTVTGGTFAGAVVKGYPLTLQVDISVVGNVGVGQDNLHSYTVPINSLAADGDYIEGEAAGNFAANNNDKNVQFSVGGTLVVAPGLLDLDGQVGWRLSFTIVRTSSTSVRVSTVLTCNMLSVDSANAPSTFTNSFYSEARNNPIIGLPNLSSNTLLLQFTGQGTADNDVDQSLTIVRLVQR